MLQPMCDKASCRDSGVTCTYTIYTLKLLVAYFFLLDLHPEQELLAAFFPTETPNSAKFSCSQAVIFKLEGCPPAATTKVTEVLCSKPILHTISVSPGNSTKIQHSPPSLNTTGRLIKYNCLSSRTTDLHLPLPVYREHSFLKIQIKPCIQDSTTVFQD